MEAMLTSQSKKNDSLLTMWILGLETQFCISVNILGNILIYILYHSVALP